jgi:hypothetical protein
MSANRPKMGPPSGLRISMNTFLRFAVATILLIAPAELALALISGSEGNDPLQDPGWPNGAAAIFNHPSRIAWWEGPPFGGGQWCAEYRGDAKTLNLLLVDVGKIEVKAKRIVLHDGEGASFWLNKNREPEKRDAARMDWNFTVWQPGSWAQQQKLPPDLRPSDLGDPESGPPVQMNVYTGGDFRWQDVTVPPEIEVDDRRLEAHGLSTEDGVVLEGRIFDVQGEQPLAAKIRIENIEPGSKGGYKYSIAREVTCGADGHWMLKNALPGWFRIVAATAGYVPRVIGHLRVEDQPGWHEFNGELSEPGPVSGQVFDAEGKPLADVVVRLHSVTSTNDARYDSPNEYETKTDAEGRFRLDMVPIGTARVGLSKEGLVSPGLGKQIETPAADLLLGMSPAATLLVNVKFRDGAKPPAYMIDIEPAGGNKIGSWGGSSNVDEQNHVMFRNVPPGKYILRGHPNPTSDREITAPIEVDLQGGEVKLIDLKAK